MFNDANKQKQRVTEELAKPTSSSNRQSYDRNNPTDIHTRPIDFLTEQEVTKLISGTKGSGTLSVMLCHFHAQATRSRAPPVPNNLALLPVDHRRRRGQQAPSSPDWVSGNHSMGTGMVRKVPE